MRHPSVTPSQTENLADRVAQALTELTVSELRVLCRVYSIAVASSARKADIVNALAQSEVVRGIAGVWRKDVPGISLLVRLMSGAQRATHHEGAAIQELLQMTSEILSMLRGRDGRVLKAVDQHITVGYVGLGICATLIVALPALHGAMPSLLHLGPALMYIIVAVALASLMYVASGIVFRETFLRDESLLNELVSRRVIE